jgi:hypothetical protein
MLGGARGERGRKGDGAGHYRDRLGRRAGCVRGMKNKRDLFRLAEAKSY